MIFQSSDPNGPLSRAVRNQSLRLNGVELVDASTLRKDVPSLAPRWLVGPEVPHPVFRGWSYGGYQMVMTISVPAI